MVSVVELRFLKHYDQTDVEEVITELYEQFVDDIVKMVKISLLKGKDSMVY